MPEQLRAQHFRFRTVLPTVLDGPRLHDLPSELTRRAESQARCHRQTPFGVANSEQATAAARLRAVPRPFPFALNRSPSQDVRGPAGNTSLELPSHVGAGSHWLK